MSFKRRSSPKNEDAARNEADASKKRSVSTPKPGSHPRGLNNLGNTCYFNSIIQPLCQSHAFHHELKNATDNEAMASSFRTICEEIQNGDSEPFSPTQVRKQFVEKVPRFNDKRQHDSHECLRHLLDEFRKEERVTNGSSEGNNQLTAVDKIFGGHLITVYICKECDKHYHLFEPCLDISLPVFFKHEKKKKTKHRPGKSKSPKISPGESETEMAETTNKRDNNRDSDYKHSIEKLMQRLSSSSTDDLAKHPSRKSFFSIFGCKSVDLFLTHFSREEKIDKEYLCQDCLGEAMAKGKASEDNLKLTSATKQTLIFNPPAILTIHFKRFELLPGGSKKRSDKVKYPEHLDLAPYCSSQCLRNDPPRNNIWYSLYAVVVHSGSLNSGHYVAYVKVREREENIKKLSKFMQQKYFNHNVAVDELTDMMSKRNEQEKTDMKSPEEDTSKWYLLNDKSVREVKRKKVLKQRAYLLFYERIDDTHDTEIAESLGSEKVSEDKIYNSNSQSVHLERSENTES